MPSPSAPLCTRDHVLLNAANPPFSLYTAIFLFPGEVTRKLLGEAAGSRKKTSAA